MVLTALRASGWLDSSTRAETVHLALYHPATQLFTSITLSANTPPVGRPVPSAWVESFRVFRGGSTTWYHRTIPEVSVMPGLGAPPGHSHVGVCWPLHHCGCHLPSPPGSVPGVPWE